jgi:chemotaxis protein methyltransferase CheR
MTLLDAVPDFAGLDTLILATDIDSRILEKAEAGVYSDQQITGIPEAFRKKYLKPTGADRFEITASVKRMIRFRELNLLHDWPMRTRFDVIFCRNVVIYFDTPTQDSLWPRFEASLHPEGWFFLGHSERISEASQARFSSVGMTAYQPVTAPQQTTTA